MGRIKFYFLGTYLYWVKKEGEYLAWVSCYLIYLAMFTINITTISLFSIKFFDFSFLPMINPDDINRFEITIYGLIVLYVLGFLLKKLGVVDYLKRESDKLTDDQKERSIKLSLGVSIGSVAFLLLTLFLLFIVF